MITIINTTLAVVLISVILAQDCARVLTKFIESMENDDSIDEKSICAKVGTIIMAIVAPFVVVLKWSLLPIRMIFMLARKVAR